MRAVESLATGRSECGYRGLVFPGARVGILRRPHAAWPRRRREERERSIRYANHTSSTAIHQHSVRVAARLRRVLKGECPMTSPRILVLGAGGMLGHKLFQAVSARFAVSWGTLRGARTEYPLQEIP